MNEDFDKFSKIILEEKPDFVLGIAKSPQDYSQFESIAINYFNKSKISKNGPEQHSLFTPIFKPIYISDKPTNSFCNWTMYKISDLIKKEKLDTKLIFLHVKVSSIDILLKLARFYESRI
jgi:pyrrolidone-carboxylate peptidase